MLSIQKWVWVVVVVGFVLLVVVAMMVWGLEPLLLPQMDRLFLSLLSSFGWDAATAIPVVVRVVMVSAMYHVPHDCDDDHPPCVRMTIPHW